MVDSFIKKQNFVWICIGCISLICSISVLFLRHPQAQDRIWELAFSFSLILGFIIASHSFFEIKGNEEDVAKLSLELENLKCTYTKEMKQAEEQKLHFEKLLHQESSNKTELENAKREAEFEFLNKLKGKEGENTKLSLELESLRKAFQQVNEQKTQFEKLLNQESLNKTEFSNKMKGKEDEITRLGIELENLEMTFKHEIEKHFIKENEYKNKTEEQENRIKDLLQEQTKGTEEIELLNKSLKTNDAKYQNSLEELQQRCQILLDNENLSNKQDFADNKTLWQAKRKAEGLHEQLREQFEEKCAILDQTRQELFHVNEVVLKMRNEEIEKDFYKDCEEKNKLILHILQMEKEHLSEIQDLKSEKEMYHQIIDALFHTL